MRPNTLLIKYPGGYLQREDAARVAAEGRVERLVAFETPYRQQVEYLADALLTRWESPWSVTAGFEPSSPAEEPYTGFNVGDGIVYPDHLGASAEQRCMAVSVTIDDEGNPLFAPELGVTPPPAPVAVASSGTPGAQAAADRIKFSTPEFTGQFGGGGGRGFVGGSALTRSVDEVSGVFAGAYGTGARAPHQYTAMAEGGDFTFSAHGDLVEAAGGEPSLIWPPFRIRSRRKLTGWAVTLGAPAASDLTVHLWHEGVEIDVATVPAGTQKLFRKLQPPVSVETGDMVYPSIDV